MDIMTMIDEMTPAIYEKLKLAVEIGKWPGGERLSPDQIETVMQATLLYAAKNKINENEPFSINANGELLTGTKQKQDFNLQKAAKSEIINIQKNNH